MKDLEILDYINYQIHYLHGLHVNMDSPLKYCRLENYAIILLFFELNKIWSCFDIKYAEESILFSYSIKQIIYRASIYDNKRIQG